MIGTLKKEFDCVIGHSDHTDDIQVPLYAAAAGAQVIEKHYKINKDMECIDSPVSITEDQMTKLITELKRLELIVGSKRLELLNVEKGTLQFRRPKK